MARTKQKPAAETLPTSHLEAMANAGFEPIRYQNKSIACRCSDERERNEWLPATFINWEKKQVAEFFKAGDGNYDFDGWESSVGHTFGGRHPTVQGALSWFQWLERQRAAK